MKPKHADERNRQSVHYGDSRVRGARMPDGLDRAALPAAPCFRCAARGWCDHRQPGDV